MSETTTTTRSMVTREYVEQVAAEARALRANPEAAYRKMVAFAAELIKAYADLRKANVRIRELEAEVKRLRQRKQRRA